jgi:hypothetical protein
MLERLRGQTVNVVLALVAVTLVVTVILTGSRVTTDERQARENNVLSAFRSKEISKISLIRASEQIVVERGKSEDGGEASWRLTAPHAEEAEAFAMDKLLGSLEFATWVRRIKPDQVERAAFGLDQPKWRLEVEMGKIRYELKLGKEAAAPAGAHYLELVASGAPGSGVGVVSRDLVTELGIDAAELRGRQLMPYLSDALERIVIEGQGGTRRLVKSGKNRWRFDGMQGNLRVDREAFDAVLVQFARTKAEHFIDRAAAERALSGAEIVRVTMLPKAKDQPKGVVHVGGSCPKSENDVVAVRKEPDPIAACVPKSVLPGLTTPAEALVDKSLFTLRKDEVESLLAQRGTRKLELERKENGFTLRAPVKAEVELDVGNGHIENILRARGKIVEKPDLKKLGLDPPRGHVTLKSAAESESAVVEETIELGSGEHVRRKLDGAVLEIDRETARLIEPDETLLRKRRLLDFAPSEFRSADITSKTQKLHQRVLREPSGAFTLELPKDFSHDASLATTLVDVLGSLEADRWVAAHDDKTFGLADPTLTAKISVDAKGGAVTHTLVVGSPTSGGYFAKLEDTPGVFVMPRRVVETLETPLLDRSVFMLPPEVESVSLEHAGKKVKLEKRGTSWTANDPELSPARIAQITEALSSLRAEAALHLGAARADQGFAKPELIVRVEPLGSDKPWSFKIGAGDSWQGTSVHYARRDGLAATYVIAKNKVRAILDAL